MKLVYLFVSGAAFGGAIFYIAVTETDSLGIALFCSVGLFFIGWYLGASQQYDDDLHNFTERKLRDEEIARRPRDDKEPGDFENRKLRQLRQWDPYQ